MSLFKNITIFSLVFVVSAVFSIQPTQARYDTLSDEDFGIESTVDLENIEFAIPKSLLVLPIVSPENVSDLNVLEWYEGLVYYQTTRFGLPAASFHYVITNDGRLIENDFSTADRKIQVDNTDYEDPIVVGYFADSGSLGFSPASKDKVTEILLDLVNKHAIPLENMDVASVDFEQTEDRQLRIVADDIFLGWQNSLIDIKSEIQDQYAPVIRTYSFEINDVVVPDAAQQIGTTFDAVFTVTNTADFPVYKGTENEPILTLFSNNSNQSQFFINNNWDSPTQVKLMAEDQRVLLPGTQHEFTVQFSTPFELGTVTEQFSITDLNNNQLTLNPAEVTIQIEQPDEEIIEILSTETGYLNVRDSASISSTEVTRVSPGQRFIVIERSTGWVKIKVDDETEGWVSSRYTQVLSAVE